MLPQEEREVLAQMGVLRIDFPVVAKGKITWEDFLNTHCTLVAREPSCATSHYRSPGNTSYVVTRSFVLRVCSSEGERLYAQLVDPARRAIWFAKQQKIRRLRAYMARKWGEPIGAWQDSPLEHRVYLSTVQQAFYDLANAYMHQANVGHFHADHCYVTLCLAEEAMSLETMLSSSLQQRDVPSFVSLLRSRCWEYKAAIREMAGECPLVLLEKKRRYAFVRLWADLVQRGLVARDDEEVRAVLAKLERVLGGTKCLEPCWLQQEPVSEEPPEETVQLRWRRLVAAKRAALGERSLSELLVALKTLSVVRFPMTVWLSTTNRKAEWRMALLEEIADRKR